MSTAVSTPWVRRALAGVLVLVLLAPVFGWAADAVGYTEPIDVAAERTDAGEHETTLSSGLLPDYSVPGLGSGVGTLIAGVVGTALTLGVALAAGRLLER